MNLSKKQKIMMVLLFLGLVCCSLLLFPGVQNGLILNIGKILQYTKINNLLGVKMLLQTASLLGIGTIIILIFCVLLFSSSNKIINEFIRIKIGSMEIKQVISEQPFLLVSFIFTLYFVKNIFLISHITGLNIIVIFVSLVLHIFICFLLYKRDYKLFFTPLVVCYFIIILSLLVNSLIYDYSYDGQSYHQTAVIHLSNGWNPFYSNLSESSVLLYDNHYPKFTWIYGSIFLSVFGNIELGKSYNIIFFVIVFIYTLKLVSKYQKNKLVTLAISILFAANPVALAQMFTYYVDGLMGMLIIILFFALMDYESRNYKLHGDKKCLFVIITVSIFAINIKFTGFVCGLVLIGYIIKQFAQKNYKMAAPLILSGVLILAIGVLFIGYNPYIINIRDFGSPFYPIYGKNSVDIIKNGNTPESMMAMNPVQRFFSLYLLDYDWKSIPFNPLKILKLASHRACDVRIGGFGRLFLEICFFALLTLFLNLKKSNYKKMFFPVFLLLFISIIIPENWWARFIPFFWYLFGLLIIPLNIKHSTNRKLFSVLFLLVIINSGTFLAGNVLNGIMYAKGLKQFITEIKNTNNENITIVLDQKYFQYSIGEKLKNNQIMKNVIYLENGNVPNGVWGHINEWY